MDFFLKINAIWRNVSIVQRALLISIVLTFAIAGMFGVQWASKPDMRVLYSGLDAEEAGKITEKISDKNVPYELKNGGTTIYVPKEHVAQLRLDMAKEGLPEGGLKGYRIFDNEKIGVSPTVQNVNLQRALQDELCKSIQMLDGVVYARVHLVTAKQTLFTSQTGDTTASVVLRLRGGYRLGPSSVAAITHMVAGAVEGLESQKVTVVDSRGNLLSRKTDEGTDGGAGTVQDYKERVEKNFENKVENMLSMVLGPGRSTVKVSAIIDMKSISTVTETPLKGVSKKEEIKSKSRTDASMAGSEGGAPIAGGEEKDETITTDYAVGKTVTQEVILPGEITSLTVAAVVDLMPDVVDANAPKSGETAKLMELSAVEKLIRNALGLKETDSLTVVEARFARQLAPLLEEEDSGGLDYAAIAGQASLGIMAICLLFVLKIFGGAGKKAAAEGVASLSAGQGTAGLLGGSNTELPESIVLRNQIAGALQNDPNQVKQLFNSWIEEKDTVAK